MFQWDKSIHAINIPANRVVSLFRSMREVQLALPGITAQQASAFLCQYMVEGGVSTVAVFHLPKTPVLAFYFSDPRVVPEQSADSILDQGLNFVESMGFLLTDQDIDQLDEDDQQMLWSALPLMAGLPEQEEPPIAADPGRVSAAKPVAGTAVPGAETAVDALPGKAIAAGNLACEDEVTAIEPGQATAGIETESEITGNVNDLLAAVEAMRAKRPGLRARQQLPSPEEMARRRQQLRETIGRILASL